MRSEKIMSLQKLQSLDADGFRQKILDERETALICFASDWSAPCRDMAGAVLQAADHFYGTVAFYLVDPDNAPLIAAEHEVASIPTLVFFARGEEQDRMVGVRKCEDLEKMIQRHL